MLSDPAVDLSDPPETAFGWINKILDSLCKFKHFHEVLSVASTLSFPFDTKESVDLLLASLIRVDLISAVKFSRKHSGPRRREDLTKIFDSLFDGFRI